MNKYDIFSFLIEKAEKYECPSFIKDDPIKLPHQFSNKKDIEIISFLVAIIAWGNRKSIIKSGKNIIKLLENSPHDFILNHSSKELNSLTNFKHRTFNGEDLKYFIERLKIIYLNEKSLENFIYIPNKNISEMQSRFHQKFFIYPHKKRTEKHIANPSKGSAAKRINMFFRWMVRSNKNGVDFGIWNKIKPNQLSCPLDIHSGKVARRLGILKRKQNDHKAVIELDSILKSIMPNDPVKLDFALFGLGIHENFK
tara:strand:+ start:835 stop:1596 length:762 start_codon:yes stop_codon:yes gene_type:complete